MDRFLDATASLLAERGFESVSTAHIAERAGVNVSSLYQYFPNKYAVFAALAERTGERRRQLVSDAVGSLGAGADWRDAADVALHELVRQLREEPGALELERALKAAPELAELNGRTSRAIVKALCRFLEKSGRFQGEPAQLEAVVYTVVEASSALALLAAEPPTDPERLMQEWKRLLESYLGGYLD